MSREVYLIEERNPLDEKEEQWSDWRIDEATPPFIVATAGDPAARAAAYKKAEGVAELWRKEYAPSEYRAWLYGHVEESE